MKKFLFIMAVAAIVSGMMNITAFAQGCSGRGGYGCGRAQQPAYKLCVSEHCDLIKSHRHGNVWYRGSGWQGDYDLCTVESCISTDIHKHNGTNYYCPGYGSGYSR